jgi:hypothetical protein
MVDDKLRSGLGLLKRREKGLPKVVNDGVRMPKRPNQLLHASRPMGIGDFIQGSLSDIQYQCIERIWEQNCGLFL